MTRWARQAAVVLAAVAALAACNSGSNNPAAPAHSVSPSGTPSASPKPVAVATCPLTGRPPTKNQDRKRVALAVKIDNSSEARPQAGLNKADLVVEETVEGGLTRLFAVFQCDAAISIGPVRSARTSDGDLLRLLNGAVFAYSGANPKAIAPVRTTSKAVLIAWDDTPGYFHTDPSRPAPHHVFATSSTLLRAGHARDPHLRAPRTVFRYGEPAHLGESVSSVLTTWPAASAQWDWTGHAWARTQNGSADLLANGDRVHATNVVVMSIAVRNTGLHDVLGNPSPDDVVTGSGQVWVFRDGHVIHGTWTRKDRADRMTFTDSHGAPLLLAPGRTWIELLPRPGRPHLS